MRAAVLCCAGTGNFGDDIIFEGMRRRLWREGFDAVESVFRITRENLGEINGYDRLVVGGGELLAGTDILDQLLDRGVTVPYQFRAVGVGTAKDLEPHLARVRASRWTARTPEDVAVMASCGIRAALEFDPITEFRAARAPSHWRLALCLRNEGKEDGFAGRMAEALDRAADEGVEVDLVAMTAVPRTRTDYRGERVLQGDCDDLELAEQIASRMRQRPRIEAYEGGPLGFLETLGAYRGIISERLHGAMAAFVRGVPFRAIPSHPKITKLLRMLEQPSRAVEGAPEALAEAARALAGKGRDAVAVGMGVMPGDDGGGGG